MPHLTTRKNQEPKTDQPDSTRGILPGQRALPTSLLEVFPPPLLLSSCASCPPLTTETQMIFLKNAHPVWGPWILKGTRDSNWVPISSFRSSDNFPVCNLYPSIVGHCQICIPHAHLYRTHTEKYILSQTNGFHLNKHRKSRGFFSSLSQ